MDLELDKLVDECFKAELPHLALILVPYLSQVNIFFIYCVGFNVFFFLMSLCLFYSFVHLNKLDLMDQNK
jgi:hypothetical protein